MSRHKSSWSSQQPPSPENTQALYLIASTALELFGQNIPQDDALMSDPQDAISVSEDSDSELPGTSSLLRNVPNTPTTRNPAPRKRPRNPNETQCQNPRQKKETTKELIPEPTGPRAHVPENKPSNYDGIAHTMEDENAEYDRLERKYRGKCELCNKMNADAWCKIGKDGKHVHLTFNQHQAWATALTQQKHGVTDDVPPNTDSFTPFHIKATAPARAPVPAPPSATPTSSGAMELLAMSLAESQRTNTAMLASFFAQNRDFTHFMAELDALHPKRNLARFINTLSDKEECLPVRDLRDLGAEYLKNDLHVPAATANWLINMARAHVAGTPLQQA
ncbi:hypothetical protein B0H14DRAFT_3855786 [Mycena olivaceomarginata]|nr:hypothetical protein B0H14DRAFT_3855786 [Mycena olivaceomarginata]